MLHVLTTCSCSLTLFISLSRAHLNPYMALSPLPLGGDDVGHEQISSTGSTVELSLHKDLKVLRSFEIRVPGGFQSFHQLHGFQFCSALNFRGLSGCVNRKAVTAMGWLDSATCFVRDPSLCESRFTFPQGSNMIETSQHSTRFYKG